MEGLGQSCYEARDRKRMRCSLNSPELQNEGGNLWLQGSSLNVYCFEK